MNRYARFFALLLLGAAVLAPARLLADDLVPQTGKTHEITFKIPGAGPMTPVKQMHVQVSVNGEDPVWMLFDTGASHPLVLSKEYAEKIGIEGKMEIQVAGVGTNTSTLVNVASLEVGGYTAEKVPAAVMDMSGITAQIKMLGISFEGILGIAFFRPFKKLELDYRGKTVRFTEYAPDDTPDLDEWKVNRRNLYNAVENMTHDRAGFMGVGVKLTDKDVLKKHKVKSGVTVSEITADGPSDGVIEEGDVLVSIGDAKIRGGPQGLAMAVAAHRAGKTVVVTLYRDGKKKRVKVTLGSRPGGNASKKSGAAKKDGPRRSRRAPKPKRDEDF